MAESLPYLDDGEQRLPSDIFPDEGSSTFEPNNCPLFMDDDLARQFTTFTLLQRNQPTSIPPPILEWLRPPVRPNPFAPSPPRYFPGNGGLDAGHSLTEYETGHFSASPKPIYQYNHLESPQSQTQVESFLQLRARVLQSQQNRSHNRVWSIQGCGVRVGGFVNKSGGTGVFLPRIATTTTTTSNEVRKKQGVRNRRETQMIQPRNSTGKHEDCHYQLSPEMSLPQDWTY